MKALEGVRVVDWTQAMAGPFCAMNLADMGADVIKVEPPEGESTRRDGAVHRNGHGAQFLAVNRKKLSDTPGAVDRPAPLVGQHTAEILTGLGYPEAEQRALRERGVI